MHGLNLERWQKVWLSKPWLVRPVPGTSQSELNGVQGFLTPGDITSLFNLAGTLPASGCYLEVGSWLGLSSIVVANGLLAALNFRAAVYCVDTWRGSAEHQALTEVTGDLLYPRFLENVRAAGMESFIRPVRGPSIDVARQWTGPELDLIFIDGDHSLEGCYRDIRAWLPRLKPEGRLLGHDAVPGGDVEAAVRRYCQEEGYRASVCPMPASHYIWEIHRAERPAAPGHRPL